jgi:hypothetical protein
LAEDGFWQTGLNLTIRGERGGHPPSPSRSFCT